MQLNFRGKGVLVKCMSSQHRATKNYELYDPASPYLMSGLPW